MKERPPLSNSSWGPDSKNVLESVRMLFLGEQVGGSALQPKEQDSGQVYEITYVPEGNHINNTLFSN